MHVDVRSRLDSLAGHLPPSLPYFTLRKLPHLTVAQKYGTGYRIHDILR